MKTNAKPISWAGDLQTAAERISHYGLSDISFEEILQREALSFDLPDLLADMDATSAGLNLDLSQCESLADYLEGYFQGIVANNNREKTFIHSVAVQSDYEKGNDEERFARLTHEMLKLDEHGREYSGGNALGDLMKYYYLIAEGGKLVDISYRRHLADAFIFYFSPFLESVI